MSNIHDQKYEKYHDIIRECYAKNIPNIEIVKIINDPDIKNATQITKIAHRIGISKMNPFRSTQAKFAEKDKEAMNLIRNGMSFTKAAKTLHIDAISMSRRLREYYGFMTLPDGKKQINSHFFSEIHTEKEAYWLGFLYADGSVNQVDHTLEVSLKKQDASHLTKLKHAMDAHQSISQKRIVLHGREYSAVRISIKDTQLVDDLVCHGCVQRKTFSIEMPQLESKELYRHFIRGYFDGDGSISMHRARNSMYVEFEFSCASLSFCKSLVAYAKDIVGVMMVIQKDARSKVFKVKTTSRFEAFRFAKHLYDDCTIFLDRKLAQYKNICRQVSILSETPDDEDGIKRGWRNVD